MGRELRMVPPNWEHPKKATWDFRKNCSVDHYIPMHNRNFDEASANWIREFQKFLAENPSGKNDKGYFFWEWEGNPPVKEQHQTFTKAEATWFQVYETVSEGTPLTPPFQTKQEIVEYLTTKGDFWQQIDPSSWRGKAWSRAAAEKFVEVGHAMSFVVSPKHGIQSGHEALANEP